jgi:Double zinc ribbon
MNCSACRRPNEERRGFCGGCGAPLGRTCARCGFRNDAMDRYCGGCGQPAACDAAAGPALQSAAPTPVPRPAHEPVLSAADVSDLLRVPPPAAPPSLPARITQDDVDQLFAEAI